MTTLPAPTMAFSPTVNLDNSVTPEPIEAPFLTMVGSQTQSFSVCKFPVHGNCSRVGIIGEGDIVADEDVVLYRHPFADERVAGNLAILADIGVFLNLDERTDFGIVAYGASIEVNKIVYCNAYANFHVWGYLFHEH